MVFAAHFFHMVELLPQGMYLLVEQMGGNFTEYSMQLFKEKHLEFSCS